MNTKTRLTIYMVIAIALGALAGVIFNFFYEPTYCKRADLNCDGQVNLADFSIMMSEWSEK